MQNRIKRLIAVLLVPLALIAMSWRPPAVLASNSPAVAKLDDDTRIVYITNTGRKYHADGCRYLKSSKIPIAMNKAIEGGYTACKVCGGG